MKKILYAFITVLALGSAAEARNLAHKEVVEHSLLDDILGPQDGSWGVSPQIHHKNKKEARRFQEEQDENWGFGSASTSLVAYGHQLQRQGFRVSEHPSFGGVHHVHHGWAHYAGRAIDVNVGRGVVEARSGYAHRFDQLAADARAAGYTVLWRVPGHYNHIHIQH